MKRIIFLFLTLYFAFSNLSAQNNSSLIRVISILDKNIFELKHVDVKTLNKNIKEFTRNSPDASVNNPDTLALRLYNILELDNTAVNPDTLLFLLENVRTYEAVYELFDMLNSKILAIEKNLSERNTSTKEYYLGGLKRNLKMVEDHMKHILEYNFCQYKNINTSNQLIKGVYIETDNDLFGFTNNDMNYTGGGRFEITTDFLKMRLLPFANKERILSYQGIFIGFKAYTPFIRDTSIFNTPASFDVKDRPFASYTFIGRSKYRIHSNGHMRLRTDFKVGVIGGDVGNIIQSIIHRDQFVSSLKPYGWDSQIAKGGRFAWNIDHYFDLMLFSGKGDIFNLNRKKAGWLNIPLMIDAHIGNELTAVGVGIGLSNLSFKDRSGNEDIMMRKYNKFRIILSANAKYTYYSCTS